MTSDGIQFELRKRHRRRNEIWSIKYDIHTGQLVSIEPNLETASDRLVISFSRVKGILEGRRSLSDFKVDFNEIIGALDLIDLRVSRPINSRKKRHTGWLTVSEQQGNADPDQDMLALLFNETGILRFETSRQWATNAKERIANETLTETVPFFITDMEDPHQLFGHGEIKLREIIERGCWETQLWSFMDHELTSRILFRGQRIRINLPPVFRTMLFTRLEKYSEFTGVVEEKTIMSHIGPGKHVSLFITNGTLWAQSHYQPGSAIDQLKGHLQIAVLNGQDLESFVSWAWLPALMLRQSQPFEVIHDWSYVQPPSALYKANNIDIGVLS